MLPPELLIQSPLHPQEELTCLCLDFQENLSKKGGQFISFWEELALASQDSGEDVTSSKRLSLTPESVFTDVHSLQRKWYCPPFWALMLLCWNYSLICLSYWSTNLVSGGCPSYSLQDPQLWPTTHNSLTESARKTCCMIDTNCQSQF